MVGARMMVGKEGELVVVVDEQADVVMDVVKSKGQSVHTQRESKKESQEIPMLAPSQCGTVAGYQQGRWLHMRPTTDDRSASDHVLQTRTRALFVVAVGPAWTN